MNIPLEVRKMILVEVLGMRILHMGTGMFGNSCMFFPVHGVCKEGKVHPGPCNGEENYERLTYREQLHLSIMRTSRQIYKEAYYVLWTTNTFSFQDHGTCAHFFHTITPAQGHQLRALFLHLKLREWFDFHEWNSSLPMKVVNELQGIQTLKIYIDDNCLESIEYARKLHTAFTAETEMEEQGLHLFRYCPLRKVSVVLVHNVLPFWVSLQQKRYQLPCALDARKAASEGKFDKAQWCAEFERYLLEPHEQAAEEVKKAVLAVQQRL